MKYRPKHVIEYGALRAITALVALLPDRAALALGAALAWLAHRLARARVAEAHRRIRQVFGPGLSDREVARIAWISLRNTFFNAIEVMRMARVDRAWLARYLDDGGLSAKLAALPAGQGAIFVVPHTGNWDLAGVAGQQMGLPIFFLVGHQKNPLVDAWLNRMRSIQGSETIARDSGALKKVIRNLRDGKVLAFMTDLRSRTPAMRVRFLGHEANVVAGMGLFARQAGVPVIPVLLSREGWTRHRWRVCDPIHPDPALPKEQDWLRMTQAVIDLYDAAIRAAPEQYFWYNKRWVLDPLPAEPEAEMPNPNRQIPNKSE